MFAALVLTVLCASTSADAVLADIAQAQEDSDLSAYLRHSRAFLANHPAHQRAPEIRYDLAMQLVATQLATPKSRAANEARALLRKIWRSKDLEGRRFDAALMLMKFAPEKQQLALADEVLRDFPDHAELAQVHLWLVPELERRKLYAKAAQRAEEALARWPELPEKESFQRVIARARLIGQRAPFTEAEWAKITLEADYVLIDFWATWCAPCLAGHEELRAVVSQTNPSKFRVIDVNLDRDASIAALYRERVSVPWPSLRFDGVEELEARFGISALPATFLVDRTGVIREIDPKLDALALQFVKRRR